jgi:hypothetical protein
MQDAVGGPPHVAIAEENGNVVAVRLWLGDDGTNEHEMRVT